MEGQSEGQSWGGRLAQLLREIELAKQSGIFEWEEPGGQLTLYPVSPESIARLEMLAKTWQAPPIVHHDLDG
jgi:hypothetical protein